MFRVVLCECMQNLTQKETLGHTPGHLTRNSQIRLKKGDTCIAAWISRKS